MSLRPRFGPSLLLSLLAACGGSENPLAPPPPPPGVPASIAVSAGGDQQGEPGKPLPIAPTVTVRTATGAPLAGVSVTFTVDSGGGAVATGTAMTDAAGVASPGAWTLGAGEGPQLLLASVATLTPARIRAQARIATAPVGSGTLSPGGMTFTVLQAGSPLNGTVLHIPPGAVSGSAPVSFAIASMAGATLPEGIVALGPALSVSTTAARFKSGAAISMPRPAALGNRTPLIAAYSPATGGMTVLTPLGNDATTVTALLPTLERTLVMPRIAGSLGASQAALRDDGDLYLFMAGVDPEVFARQYDSHFRAQQNNWDFDNFAIAWLPFLGGTSDADPADEVIDPSSGMVATSLWYFENRKGDVPLYGRFRLQADQAKSNKVGIRWSALANAGAGAFLARAYRDLDQFLKGGPAVESQAQFNAMKVMFYNTLDRPIPVLLYDVVDAEGLADGFAVGVGIATRTVGDAIEIVVPDNKESPYLARVDANGLVPFTVLNRTGDSYQVKLITPLPLRYFLELPGVASNWSRVADGSVGEAEGWPTPELHWEKGKLDPKAVFLDEATFEHWWECPGCPDFGTTFTGAPPSAKHLLALQMGRITAGAMAPWNDERRALGTIKWKGDSVASDETPTTTGQMLLLPQPKLPGTNSFPAGWLDWQTVTYKRVSLKPSPATIDLTGDQAVTFTLAPTQALPAGTTFSWVFVNDDGRDSVATATPTHAREFRAGKGGELLILAHEAGTRRVIARDKVIVKATGQPYWKITAIADQDALFDEEENDGSGPVADALKHLIANPASGLIGINQVGEGSEILLRIKMNGTWGTGLCCPPGPLGGDFPIWLGKMPEVHHQVGAPFAGWDVTRWSQTTTDLSSGTITGQYVDGTVTYHLSGGGTMVGPTYVMRITATRTGTTMTGTISATIWFVDSEGETDPDAADVFRFPFTAVRMQ